MTSFAPRGYDFKAIRAAHPLKPFLEGRGIVLRKAGASSYAGKCPFHEERTASFHVYPGQERWHCFGACNAGGDVVDALERLEGVDRKEALRRLTAGTPEALAPANAAPKPAPRDDGPRP